MAEQEQAKELYELCIEANKQIEIQPNLTKSEFDDEAIEKWIDSTIERINKELTEQYNNDPHYKNMDLGEKAYLYFDEQIKQFFKSMQIEEHKDLYLTFYSYEACCYCLTRAISKDFKKNNEIKDPNSLLKLNLYNIYEYWYETNNFYTNNNSFKEILKKHNITLEQITNINWIIENKGNTEKIFNEYSKKNEDDSKEWEKLKKKYNKTVKKIKANSTKKLEKAITDDFSTFPVDRVNEAIFNQYYINKNHQQPLINGIPRYMELPVGKGLENDDISVFVDINMEETPDYETIKNFNAYDKNVYTSIYDLIRLGNSCISLQAILYRMTGKKEIAQAQKENLINSMKKMMTTWVDLTNDNAIKHGMDYDLYNYNGPFLPGVFTQRIYKGKLVDCYENYFYTVPLIAFAIACNNQYLTLEKEVLQIPLNMTKNNLQLRDYLISNLFANFKNTEISKRGKQKRATKENRNNWSPKKLKLETIYKELGITKTNIEHTGTLNRTKKDTLDKAEQILQYWIKLEKINRYKISKDNKYITVYYH